MEYNYFFCEICNRNQVKNKRHIYSKKHRERLNFLLKRQSEVYYSYIEKVFHFFFLKLQNLKWNDNIFLKSINKNLNFNKLKN